MNSLLRKLVSPILNVFERNNEEYVIHNSSRKILYAISGLFLLLGLAPPAYAPASIAQGYWFIMIVFGGLGITGLIVAIWGSDKAVAKILGSK